MKFRQHTSGTTTVEAGVPQGSVLGPTLFIAFTYDLAEHLRKFTIKAYADDTQILVAGRTAEEVKQELETAISIAQTWFKQNSL